MRGYKEAREEEYFDGQCPVCGTLCSISSEWFFTAVCPSCGHDGMSLDDLSEEIELDFT